MTQLVSARKPTIECNSFTIISTSKLGLCRTLFNTISKWHWETKNLTRTQILMIWSWRRSRQDTSEDGKTQFGTQHCSWVTTPRSGRNLQMFIQRWGFDMRCDHHDIYSTPINRYIYCSEPDIGCWRGWVDWEASQAVEWSWNISANSSLLHYKPFWFLRYIQCAHCSMLDTKNHIIPGRKGYPCFKATNNGSSCMSSIRGREHPALGEESLEYLRRHFRLLVTMWRYQTSLFARR